jgi:hypothetical protein
MLQRLLTLRAWEHGALVALMGERAALTSLVLTPLRQLFARAEIAEDEEVAISLSLSLLAVTLSVDDDEGAMQVARAFLSAGGRHLLVVALQRHLESHAVVAAAQLIVERLRHYAAAAAGNGKAIVECEASHALISVTRGFGVSASTTPPEELELAAAPQASPAATAPQASPTSSILAVATALHTCAADEAGDLHFARGDKILVTLKKNEHWWYGQRWEAGVDVSKQEKGLFPANYVREIQQLTTQLQNMEEMLKTNAITKLEYSTMMRVAMKKTLEAEIALRRSASLEDSSTSSSSGLCAPSPASVTATATATTTMTTATAAATTSTSGRRKGPPGRGFKQKRMSIVKLQTEDGHSYFYDDPLLGGSGATAWDEDALAGDTPSAAS